MSKAFFIGKKEVVKSEFLNYFSEAIWKNERQTLVHRGKFAIYSIYKKTKRWWRGGDVKKTQIQYFVFEIEQTPRLSTTYIFRNTLFPDQVFQLMNLPCSHNQFLEGHEIYQIISTKIIAQLVDFRFFTTTK